MNANSNGSSRMTSNSLSQQSNSTRQQTNNNQTVGGTTNADTVTHLNDNKASTSDDKPKQLTDMPLEIFERIFQYSGYKEVSNMRLVSVFFLPIKLKWSLRFCNSNLFFDPLF